MLHCRSCTATLAFLQRRSRFDQKLHCSKRKTALQHRKKESGAFLPLSCGFQAPRLGTHVSDLLNDLQFTISALFCVEHAAFPYGSMGPRKRCWRGIPEKFCEDCREECRDQWGGGRVLEAVLLFFAAQVTALLPALFPALRLFPAIFAALFRNSSPRRISN